MTGRGPYHVRRSQLRAGTAIRGSLPLIAIAVLSSSQAQATDFWWDGGTVNGGNPAANPQGGNGTWNTSLTNWDNAAIGGADVAWVNGDNHAIFVGGIAYTVTLGTPITAGDITVASGGADVTMNGSALTLVGTPVIDIGSGGNLVINSAVAGTSGLTKVGTGTLVLTAPNTYTGATTVSAGTLSVGNGGTTGSLSGSSPISVASGATFAWNNNNNTVGRVITNTLTGAGTVLFQGQNATTALQTSVYDNNGDWSGFSGEVVLNCSIFWNNTAQSQVGTGTIRVQDRATMSFNGGTFSNDIVLESGAGWHHNVSGNDVVIGGIRLKGNNTLSGNITLNGAANPIVLGDNTGANSTIGSTAAAPKRSAASSAARASLP